MIVRRHPALQTQITPPCPYLPLLGAKVQRNRGEIGLRGKLNC
jgi:hypothetical protein